MSTRKERERQMAEQEIGEKVNVFIRELKHGDIQGSYTVALNTLQLLRKIIAQTKWKTASEIITTIKEQGKRMIAAQPCEMAVENMICRVLKIIRDECARLGGLDDKLKKLFTMAESRSDFLKQEFPNFKSGLIEIVNELIAELEVSRENIATQAIEHIHANEVILTSGKSSTVEAFLKKAAKKRKFQVIVVESAPFFHIFSARSGWKVEKENEAPRDALLGFLGHDLALSLSTANIDTTLITDSAVFAIMARVNKVIIGTHTVLANGGMKAFIGSHAIASAAKFYSVPMIVCAAQFKLSHRHLNSVNKEKYNKYLSPQDVLPFTEGEILSKVQIYNPVFDYVPADLVTLFITNIQGNAPSNIYRLVSELYSPEDQTIDGL